MQQKCFKYYCRWIFLIFSFLLIIYSFISILLWKNDKSKITSLTKKLKNESIIKNDVKFKNSTLINPPEDKSDPYWNYVTSKFLQVDFTNLLEQNKDTVAWIQVNGTKIDYPVVQTKNNKYYLTHSFDKSENKAGWIFLDFRNNLNDLNNNTIIYGHGRKDNTMFGSLRYVLENEWYNKSSNHIIKLSTPKQNTIWQIFSVYTIKKENYYITTNFNKKDFKKFLELIIKRSKFSFLTDVNVDDNILTLSTCLDTSGNRIVIHAKLIKKGTN